MSPDTLPTIHGYKLIRALGKGSYGSVWEARASGGFPAALKFISLAHSGNLAEPELKALEESKELNHPHLIQTREFFMDNEWVIIVMEFAAGTLRERFQYCRQNGEPGIPVNELLHYTREAADALDYLHGLNKLHRDIKPDNLLITTLDSPHIKVGDCGLLRDRDRMSTLAAQGSPPYIAPEAWGAKTVPASDQFSLAATYVELRLGRLPFEGSDPATLSMAIQFLDPDLAGMEVPEQEVLKIALAKTPEGRFLTCRDFVVALEAALSVSAATYRPKGKIGLVKKAVNLAPPRIEGASLKPASQPVIDISDAPAAHPGPPVTFPPPGTASTRPPATMPPPPSSVPISGTLKTSTDGTLPREQPARQTTPRPPTPRSTPRPPTYGTGTLMPNQELIEPVSEPEPAPEELHPEPPHRPDSKPGPVRPRPPSGLGVGAILAALLIVVGLGAGGYFAVVSGLFSTDDKDRDKKDAGVVVKDKDKRDETAAKDDKAKKDELVSAKDDTVKKDDKGKKDDAGKKDDKGKKDDTVRKDDKGKDNGPMKVKLLVPAGFLAANDAKEVKIGDKVYASRALKKMGTEEVVFVLVPAGEKTQPFYVMKDKVWNGLYALFANERSGEAGDSWMAGGLKGAAEGGNGNKDLPALRMKRGEAAAFAEWLCKGRLPTAEELDQAAGFYRREKRVGPAKNRNVAVGRRADGPRPIDEESGDVSPFEVRDLSGNGREWTTDELMAGGETMAVLRGQSYTAQSALSYEDLEEMRKPAFAPTQYPNEGSPYTGFRVVVPLP